MLLCSDELFVVQSSQSRRFAAVSDCRTSFDLCCLGCVMSVRNQFDYYREVDGDVARFESDGTASCLMEGVDHLLEALREIHGKDGRPDIAVQLNRIVQRKYL
jgi:hypothetical protein